MRSKILSNLTFIVGISAFLLSCNKKEETMFEELASSKTNINFTNKLSEHKLFNILYYLYYYNGGGVAAGDINNDGLTDLYFTANNKGGNKLYLNKGNFVFEDITTTAGVAGNADWCSGVTMADVNGDGLLDIYTAAVSGRYDLKGRNELYINKGNGKFTESAEQFGLGFSGLTTQTAFFDYDRDGDLDCYILNQSHHPHANIVDTSNRRKVDSLSGDRLYRNDISTIGKFSDVSSEAGIFQSNLGYGLGLGISDINNDGWDDIYVGNDFHENDYYYINNGNGSFTESGAKHFKHYSRFSMGNDIADFNNDGQLDVVTVDMLPPDEKILKTYGSDENPDIYKIKLEMNGYQNQYSRNVLQRNNGNGNNFSDIALMSGISATDWSWAPLFADFDNDGNKDLFITSGIVKRPVDLDYIRYVSDLDMKKGRQQTDEFDEIAIKNMPEGSSHPYFYQGNGAGNFEDKSLAWGTGKMKGFYNGAAYADLDNDGDLDVIINCIDEPAVIMKNNAPLKTVADIVFKGTGMNPFGIGAKLWLFAGGKMQYQQLMLTRGFQSSVEPKLHFGLDSLRLIDTMLVVWPDQKYQLLKNVPSVGRLEVRQSEAGGSFDYKSYFGPVKEAFRNVTEEISSSWRHTENDFLDYNKQYLIPHQLSTRGPKIAVADVNKDGLDDLFACGAIGSPGTLLLQVREGVFTVSDSAVFNKAAMCENVDAHFFDANNDGYPDLYVVNGGNEYRDDNLALQDEFYLNDGKGHFSRVQQPTASAKNKSCVSSADIDKDGDIDLFIGGLANAMEYGKPQTSYLLINDGKGGYTPAASSMIALDSIGMVTSSSFADINNDGWQDLVVTGEWMTVQIYINKNGRFTKSEIPASSGLWQSLLTADVNGDGFTDILAGNWGLNSKLAAGKTGPLKLYVKDFDKNGSVEQVMAYTIDGEEYTFLAKDELERSLPVLKKAYLKYSDVAGKTVQYMFYDLFKDYKELKAEVLASSCFINDGKGNFTRVSLPFELQVAPIFSFSRVEGNGGNSFVAGGNFYGVVPYEGRYDGLPVTVFSYNRNAKTFAATGTLPGADGETRDIKWINSGNGKKLLVIAGNNMPLQFFRYAE